MKDKKQIKSTILIIDDNPFNLDLLFDLFKNEGYKTLIATSGEGGIQTAELTKPDIILLDVMMPNGIDGFETCNRLKNDPKTKEIPIIFMTALTDTDNKIKGFELGAADYITKPFQGREVLARVTKELMIQQQQKELRDLNASKDKFFSIIAHDLKSPFSALIFATRYLYEFFETFEKDELKKSIGDLHYSIRNVYLLIENLLEWARVQTGAIHCEPEPLNICQLLKSVITISEKLAETKGIRIVNTIDSERWIYADMQMVDTVFRNLLSNAVKFTHKGGEVSIHAKELNEFIEVMISDSGVGIQPQNIQKLFRIDEQCSISGTAGEKGTGLGLILCKEFIEKNGGTIRAESELGKGSRFYFTLPKPDPTKAESIDTLNFQ